MTKKGVKPSKEKPMINIVFIGHIDHGKSTLLGRLFYELGKFPEELVQKYRRHAEGMGKSSWEYAYFMDRTMQERQKGITIEISFQDFETDDKRFNIIDAPGHRRYVTNMISGASEADAAILVVDVNDTYNKGIMNQTREHSILVHNMGVEQLVVVINKMDKDEVAYSQEIFELVKGEMIDFLSSIGCESASDFPYIPTSAYEGQNVSRQPDRMPWYDGPTLLDALNALEEPPRLTDFPLRMPILRAFSVRGTGTVVAGKIETGVIRSGDTIVIVPYPGTGSISATVKSLEWLHHKLDEAGPGMDVGLAFSRTDTGFNRRNVKKGAMVGSPSDPPLEAERFKATLVPFGSGQVSDSGGVTGAYRRRRMIRAGYSPTLYCHQAVVPCTIVGIENWFDMQTRQNLAAVRVLVTVFGKGLQEAFQGEPVEVARQLYAAGLNVEDASLANYQTHRYVWNKGVPCPVSVAPKGGLPLDKSLQSQSLEVAKKLLRADLSTEEYLKTPEIQYAQARDIPYVVVLFEREVKKKDSKIVSKELRFTIINLQSGQQQQLDSANRIAKKIIAENQDMFYHDIGATVWIEPQEPLVIEEQGRIPRLARFALRDALGSKRVETVATGICIEVVPKVRGR